MKLIESKTISNLARAFAGETQAMARYRFIEYGARNEGYSALAEIIEQGGVQRVQTTPECFTRSTTGQVPKPSRT